MIIMLTHFVFLQPGIHILDDVRLVLQLVDEALQLGEVSRVVDRLHRGEFYHCVFTSSELILKLILSRFWLTLKYSWPSSPSEGKYSL